MTFSTVLRCLRGGRVPCVLLLVLFSIGLFAISQPASEPVTVEIVCQKSYYTPDKITLKKGERARIVLKSMDVTHGFAIDEFKIAKEVSPGPPVMIEFTPERSGNFVYYCVIRCGKEHLKMRGVLTVQD
jgi:cytochrome c oxidase subunit 2